MALLGRALGDQVTWLIVGWLVGLGVMVVAAGLAGVGWYLRDRLTAPEPRLAAPAATRRRIGDAGHRFEVAVENDGRQDAGRCRATLRLSGTNPDAGTAIRVSRPLGWLDPGDAAELDPDALPRSATLAAGETRRLLLGHTSPLHYRFVLPDVGAAGDDGIAVRPLAADGPGDRARGDPGGRHHDGRGLAFRQLNATDWETAVLELDADGAPPVRYRVRFEAALVNQEPTIRFERVENPPIDDAPVRETDVDADAPTPSADAAGAESEGTA